MTPGRWFGRGGGAGGSEAAASGLVEVCVVPLAQGPMLVSALEAQGLAVVGIESFDVVTDTRGRMRIMVRPQDLAVASEIAERSVQNAEQVSALEDLDAGAGDEADGEAAQNAMAELFVAADRLLHASSQEELIDEVARLRGSIAPSAPPFGIEVRTWHRICEGASAVGEVAESGDEDAVVEAARELRSLLRDYV